MAELGASWGAAVKGGLKGSYAAQQAETKDLLSYLDDRSKATQAGEAFEELVTLSDRNLFGQDSPYLDVFSISGEYTSDTQEQIGGSVQIAVGTPKPLPLPIDLSLSASAQLSQSTRSTADLKLSATFRSRPRSDEINALANLLNIRPQVNVPGTVPLVVPANTQNTPLGANTNTQAPAVTPVGTGAVPSTPLPTPPPVVAPAVTVPAK